MTARVVIDQLRITGIAGRVPTPAEVQAALASALTDCMASGAPRAAAIRGGRIVLPAGAKLADAARAVAAAVQPRASGRAEAAPVRHGAGETGPAVPRGAGTVRG